MDLPELLAVARGDAPADLLLRGGRVVNVFTGEVEHADVAIGGGAIAGVGDYSAAPPARETLDLGGAFVAPGFVDAHVHIESSLCVPAQFAAAVVPRGTTLVVTDPHEIANVVGAEGVRAMARASAGLPLTVVQLAPSCVPATPLATSGAALGPDDLAGLLREGVVAGLAEVMNYPGVVTGDPEVLAKVAPFAGLGLPVDGHCPGLGGPALNAYAAAGVSSDHESTRLDEARDRLRRGLYVFLREATNARNLRDLLPLVTPATSRRICLCTDDRTPADLLDDGGIDHMVRECIAFGLPPVEAIRLATLNPCERFGLKGRGAVAPGYAADLVVFDDLDAPRPRRVYVLGTLVAEDGALVGDAAARVGPGPATSPDSSAGVPAGATGVFAGATGVFAGAMPAGRCVVPDDLDLSVVALGETVRVIGCRDGQLVTDALVLPATVEGGRAVADPSRDVLKMAVVERHGANGNVGLGFIRGVGLKRGAIAGTVAHDHHNLVVIGADDESMRAAARAVASMGGGLAVAEGGAARATLPLPVAGLMSDRPIAEVRAGYDALLAAARDLGSPLHDPFMAMSFMALEVIPDLKLTDRGLVDVTTFQLVDLFAPDDEAIAEGVPPAAVPDAAPPTPTPTPPMPPTAAGPTGRAKRAQSRRKAKSAKTAKSAKKAKPPAKAKGRRQR